MLIGGIVRPDFYVAANGSDSNSGTRQAPWLTIAKVNASNVSNKTVYFRGGDRFYGTLALQSNARYTSYGTGRACISGGSEVTGWTLHDVPKNIWRATWNAGRPRVLWVDGLRVARCSREALPSGTTETATGYSTASSIDPGYMSDWANKSDIEFLYRQEWRYALCPVASVSGNDITMLSGAFTSLSGIQDWNSFSMMPVQIFNAYEMMLYNPQAGTFYHDRISGYVYMIPPVGVTDPNDSEVIAPILNRVVFGESVSNISARNLELSHTVNLDVYVDGFSDVQATVVQTGPILSDPVTMKKMKAAVELVDCTNVILDRNLVRHIGTAGVGVSGVSTDCEITGNIIYDISGNGIQVGDPNQNAGDCPVQPATENNYIFDCAQEFRGGVGVLQLWATEAKIRHNLVKQMPYSGISAGWGWGREPTPNGNEDNITQLNHIFDTNTEQKDGGGLYLLSRSDGELVDSNFVHDVGPGAASNGIYPDEASYGRTISNNVVASVIAYPYFENANVGGSTYINNTSDGLDYYGSSTPPNTKDAMVILSTETAMLAGAALGAGLESSYADVKAEGDILSG